MVDPGVYTVGGTVQANRGIYISRQADQELLRLCQANVFAYVLAPRQIGKSSLMVHTATQLQQAGVRAAIVDLQELGASATADQWYLGFLLKLADVLRLPVDAEDWWQEREYMGVSQRLTQFIEQVLLTEIADPIVIFVDEIDTTLSLSFTDDFFTTIRYLYLARAQIPDLQRLSFVLIGVATPGDLIRDPQRTPFNIGQRVDIKGFQFDEALPLITGFADRVRHPEAVLQAILSWTGGQPFLTQKVCKLILTADSTPIADETQWVEQLVRSNITENWESQDEPNHLRTIRDRLLQNEQQAGWLLGLYQKILQEKAINSDGSEEQIRLKLSGLVEEQARKLRAYNQIYESIFNQEWVDDTLDNLRPYAEAITVWLKADRQDESLLKGQALQDAQEWARGRSLSNQDFLFLTASQEKALEAERLANQRLEEIRQRVELALAEEKLSNGRLKETQRKTRQTFSRGLVGLIGLAGGTALMVAIANRNLSNLPPVSSSPPIPSLPPDLTLTSQVALYAEPSVVRVVNGCTGKLQYNNGGGDKPISLSLGYGTASSGFLINSNGYIATYAVVSAEACKENLYRNLVTQLKRDSLTDDPDNIDSTKQSSKLENFTYYHKVILPGTNSSNSFEFQIKETGGLIDTGAQDIAIIKIDLKNTPSLKLGSSRVGLDDIITIGYPVFFDPTIDNDEEFLRDDASYAANVCKGRISNPNKTLDNNSPVFALDIEHSCLSAGSPTIDNHGEVIGIILLSELSRNLFSRDIPESIRNFRSTPLVIPSNVIKEFIQSNGISNEQGAVDRLYREGLELFWERDYEGARIKFESVRQLFPYHAEATRLINQSSEELISARTKPNFIFWIIILLSVGIIILSLSYLAYLLKQRRSI